MPHDASAASAARGESEFDRGFGFVDAVYGFAATLLVANVDAPPASAWRSLPALLDSEVPQQLFGLALSFAVIAVFWRRSVRLTRRLAALDGPTMFANLVAAGLVVLIPFTTQGISDPATAPLALATIAYALNVAAVAVAQLVTSEIARRRGLEHDPEPARMHRIALVDELLPPVYLVLTTPVAVAFGGASGRLAWLGLLVVGPLSALAASRARAAAAV